MIAPDHKPAFRSFIRNFRILNPKYAILVFAGCLAVFLSAPASAQSNVAGRFVGIVINRDTGRPIPGARATFTNTTTGAISTAIAGDDGIFSKFPLQPGEYEIEVSATGFQTKKANVQNLYAMLATEVEPKPFELIPETAAVTPTPTPTGPVVNPSPTPRDNGDGQERPIEPLTLSLEPSRGGAFNDRQIQALPLGGTTLTRTFDELAFYIPGVNPPPQAIGNTVGPGVGGGVGTSGQFSVNGLRSRANNFTVDGSDNNDEDIGVRRQGFFTLVPQPIESIQEFSIITLLAPAQYGRNLGAQVNANSKGGGNAFHGTIYGMGSVDALNSRNPFDTASGITTTPLMGRRSFDGQLIPVFVDNQQKFVTNDAGRQDAFSLLQGGFAVGGPIWRNKLFFFASGEGQHMDGTRERHFAVPTVEQRGIFGTGAQGLLFQEPDGTITPFFPSALDSEVVYSMFPFPNDPNGIFGRNTFSQALSTDARGIILSGRVDWNVFKVNGNQQLLTARYNFTDDKRDLTDVAGALFSAIRPLVRTDNVSTFLSGSITNNFSNEFRFSYGRTRLRFEELRDDFLRPVSRSFNNREDARFLLNAPLLVNNTIAFCANGDFTCDPGDVILADRVDYVTNATAPVFSATTEPNALGLIGQLIVAGFSPVGVDVFNFPQARVNDTFQFADTVRTQFNAGGQHNFAFGTDIRRTFLTSDLPRNSRPLVTFGGALDFTGQSIQDIFFPLDLVAAAAPTGFFQTLVLPGNDARIDLSYHQLNFFGQDEWRVRRNLLISAGLRYEYNTPPEEADRKIENSFSAPLPNFLSGLRTFIDGRDRIFDPDRNNFAPRLGFAYAPTENTVIRGGYGIYYDQILGAVVSQSRNVLPTFNTINFGGGLPDDDNSGLISTFTFLNPIRSTFFGQPIVQPGTLNTLNPNIDIPAFLQTYNGLFPSINNSSDGSLNAPGTAFGATLPQRQLDTPFSHQYSIGIEHRLFRDTFISAAYVGTTGRDLLRFTTPNLGNNYLVVVTRLTDIDLEPAVSGITFAPFDINNPFERPVPRIGSIEQYETTGRSQYNSLQIELRGRLTRNFQYRTNYVYGKANDDVSDVFDLAGAFALPQNSLTFAGEYAPANFDVRHRFTYNFVFDTPELRDQSSAVRFLLGGWQVAGTGKFNTGQPFTVNSIFDVNLDGNLTDRLNNTNFITLTGDRQQPLALAGNADLASMLAPLGEDGSVPRNSFRAGSILELDLAFAKRFRVKEDQSLQLRVDVFNFIDRANYGVPVRFLESPGFGRATDTVTPGRRFQFMVRYYF